MDQIKINGKMYDVECSIGKIQKVTALTKDEEKWDIDDAIIALWVYLKRVFIFKPFIFKWRLKNKITPSELARANSDLAKFMSVEDRDGGNLD